MERVIDQKIQQNYHELTGTRAPCMKLLLQNELSLSQISVHLPIILLKLQTTENNKQFNMHCQPRSPMALFALLAALVAVVRSDCPISYYPRQTTIGYVRVDIDITPGSGSRSQVYEYPLVEELKSTAYSRTVIGVNGFSFDKQTQQYGFKIQPSLPANPTTSVMFTVSTVGQRKWKYITFNFIVSDSSELVLGSKNMFELTPTANPNYLKVSEQLILPSNSYNYRATAKVFLSGFQVRQKNNLSKQNKQKIEENVNKLKNFVNHGWNQGLIKKYVGMLSIDRISSLRIDSAMVNQNGLLTFQIITSQIQLKALSYSFIVYFQRINSEVFYQTITGSFNLGDQDTHFYNNLEHDDMKILGFSGFKFSSDINETISLEVRTGVSKNRNFYIGAIQGIYSEFNFQYFAISSLPGAGCKTCPGSPLIYQEFCVSECPYGFVSSVNSDGSYFCHECNVQGFLIASEDKSKCTCASGHYLVSPIQQCTKCPYDCLTCNGNICLTCDTPKLSSFRVLNPSTGRCECPANAANGIGLYDDYSLQQRACVLCNPRCKTCRGPEINDCLSCGARRTLYNGMCRCEDNLVEYQNGQCVCMPPYSQNQYGQCTLTGTQCKENEVFVTVQQGQKLCNCKPGYTRSLVSNICIKECQSYEQYNYVASTCECREGLVRNTTSKLCYSCSSRLNRVFNDQTKSCECMPGFQINRAGECTSCPSKTYFNIKNDSCECIFNYYRQYDNGPCIKCRSEWDGPSCQKLSNMQGLEL